MIYQSKRLDHSPSEICSPSLKEKSKLSFTNPFLTPPSFDEKRDKRRKFLAKASYNLRISQDELEQKKQALSQSFEPGSIEHRKLHSSSVPRSRMGQSLPRGNTKQPLRTSNDHENKTENENIHTDYFEDLLNPRRSTNERTENNFHHTNTHDKSFDTKRLEDSARETPFLNLGATTTLSNTLSKLPNNIQGENRGAIFTQTDCSTNFDGDYGFFEGKLKDILEKEKKQIIEMNTSQIAQLEEKMKDKYNFMVKKVLETQAKESQDKSRLVSQASQTQNSNYQTPIVKVNPRGYNITSAVKDNMLNNSLYSDVPTNNLKEKNSYFNTTHLLSEIKHMKHDLFGPSEVKVSRQLFPQNGNLDESLQFIRQISNSYQGESYDENNLFAEKINELEVTNKNLLMKVSFLEGVVSSAMKNNSAVKTLLGQNPQKENLDNSFIKTRNNSSHCITPQKEKNNDFSNQQIAEQLKMMNKKIDHLTKANQDLTAKNKILTENIQTLNQNNQKESGESAEFWKEKCKVLVEKYFQVIKKIKSDHLSVTEDLRRDYNKLKTKISSNNTGEIHQFISTVDLNEMFAHQQQPGQKQRSNSQQPKNRELRSASRKNRENIPN